MSSAGQIVGGIIGAVVGFFTAGPGGAVQGAMYGAGVGIAVGGAIDPPKGPDLVGPRLDDLSQQTSTYGVNIPRVYGAIATRGNVFWLEGGALKERKKKKDVGGKGGSSSTTTTYSYSATFAIGLADTLGRAPVVGIRRIWLRGKLWYDAGSDDLETIVVSNQRAAGFVFYTGSDTQMPDPRMQADIGALNCPAYRGLAYIVFHDLPLEDFSNTLAAVDAKVEIVSASTASGFEVIASYPVSGPARQYGMSALCMDDDGVVVFKNQSPYSFSGFTDVFRVLHTGQEAKLGTIAPANNGIHIDGWSDLPVLVTSSGGVVTVQGQDGLVIAQAPVPGVSGSQQHAYYQRDGDRHVLHSTASGAGVYAMRDGAAVEVFSTPASYPYGILHDIFPAEGGGWFGVTQSRVVVAYDSAWALLWQVDISASMSSLTNSPGGNDAIVREMPDGSVFVWQSSHGYAIVTSSGYSWHSTVSLSSGYEMHGGQHLIGRDVLVLADAYNNTVKYVRLTAAAEDAVPLSSIVSAEIAQSAVIDSSDVDVSGLYASVRGYRVSSVAAIRAAIEPLRAAWPFDVIQSGYKIRAVPRGGASVATIYETDLDARQTGAATSPALRRQREMDTQLPARVSVKYLDHGREYDVGEQAHDHLSTDAVHVQTLDLQIVLTDTEAAGVAQQLSDMYWLERYETQITIGPEHGALEPGDVVTLSMPAGSIDLRLVQIDALPDGRLQCQCRDSRPAVYSPNATGAAGSDGGATISIDGPSLYYPLDIPVLRDSENTTGFAVAMAGYTSAWPGGLLLRSADSGQTWDVLQAFVGSVPMGYCGNTLSSTRFDLIDRSSSMSVKLVAGEIYSVSIDAMLAGANLFAYGIDGRWEIIAVQTAVDGGGGNYTLTNILRGLAGTEWAAGLHATGDVLIKLDDADVAWISADSASIGQSRMYRGVTIGRDISTDSTREFTYRAENLKPLSPVYLNGNRHPSSGDWSLSWTRRGRVDARWRDLVDVPVGESSEAYEIEIYAGSSYATIKRTLASTAPTVSYTSAQQVADFGANQSTLYVRIYQMSATVGRGRPLQTSITR